jgi:hypothetical protein
MAEGYMAKASRMTPDVEHAVVFVKALPRHGSKEFRFPREDFIAKLVRLMEELDDIGEFTRLESLGQSFVLTIRHR